MTTAHRPTFDPARGKDAQRGPVYHHRLMPAHQYLKRRQKGQGGIGGLSTSTDPTSTSATESSSHDTAESSRRDLQKQLEQAEGSLKRKGADGKMDGDGGEGDGEGVEDPEAKRRRLILEEAHDEDADTSDEDKGSQVSDSSSEDDSDSDDDEAALRRELEKIKAERAAAKQKELDAQAAKDAEQREYDIARGNPLLNDRVPGGGGDYTMKRRWDDDVVFKNQARGTEEKRKREGKEFVNDLLRSDFHRRFMSRYVR